jgi:branched-chain amino acid transport system substrate-binding protein
MSSAIAFKPLLILLLAALGGSSILGQMQQLQAENTQLKSQISDLNHRHLALCASGKTLTIGELTDLSSGLSIQGLRVKESSLLAINDINSFLSQDGCKLTFAITIDDYALDNARALSDLQSLSASGAQVVVGPLNSGATRFILSFADANHIVLISPSSTASALAIPNDYLFRTAPNDAAQGAADARMMVDRGASAVIILQRHDSYGDSVANSTATRFKALGGNVVDIIPYDASAADAGTINWTPPLSVLNSDFNRAAATYGSGKVAIDVVAFEEFSQMITTASQMFSTGSSFNFPWSTLPWFGTDAVAGDPKIIAGSAGPLVAKVKLASTLYVTSNTTKGIDLSSRFATAYPGNFCDTFCLQAYDDVWLGAYATLIAGSYDGTKIQAIMLSVASNFYGATGWMGLQPSGDRVPASYQIWDVINAGSPSVPTWIHAGTWDGTSDAITWTSPP